jgi:uncharacterized membrane protein YjjP (DUF1212 family)
MTLRDHCNLVLAVARVLYVNGQSTNETVAAAEGLAHTFGMHAAVMLRWGQIELEAGDSDQSLVSQLAADPAGVDMQRVAAVMGALEDIRTGRLPASAAASAIESIAKAPPAPTWLFTLAAAVGAAALAVIFGVSHVPAVALILLSAAAGAIARRALARRSANLFTQPFCAALIAGIIGGVAVRYDLSSSLRLVAVCPCMVLVPGPHLLNSALDLVSGRIHLGAARLLYVLLIVVAISTGLLLGLALLGVSLPVDPSGRAVPLWEDVLAAGIAVFAYSVFFSTPLKMLLWPVTIGMLAHAARWATLSILGLGVATGALVACALVGLILTPVSRRWHMPFAAIGFASVVSMVPGVYLFRVASGLVQLSAGAPTMPDLLSATVADGTTALDIILAMSFGLIVPKMMIDRIYQRQR